MANILLEKVWEVTNNGEPIYSSPVVKNDKVIYQSWDWYGYVRNLSDGSLDFRRPFSDVLYGAPACADINNDGNLEYIFASHAGEIRCYSHDNRLLWSQTDEFTRAEGLCDYVSETETTYTLRDPDKNYAEHFGIRNINSPNENANVMIDGYPFSLHEIKGTDFVVLKNQNYGLTPNNQFNYNISPAYNSDKIFQHAGVLNQEDGHWYLYITGMDFCLRKIDCLTGEVLWVFSSKEASEPYPFIADLGNGVNVFFVSVDWYVYCLDLSGNLLWKRALNGGIDSFSTMITLSNGDKNLVISCRDGCIYEISKDGSIMTKSVNTQADIDCRPVVYDFDGDGKQEIICGGDAGFIYGFDENLKTLWRTNIGTYLNSSGVMADVNYDGKMEILWGDMGGVISVLDPTNGKILYQICESGSVEGTPSIGDFDDDGLIEMIVTVCDGTIKMYRFEKYMWNSTTDNILLNKQTMINIADAVREKNKATNLYKAAEIPQAILDLETGSPVGAISPLQMANVMGLTSEMTTLPIYSKLRRVYSSNERENTFVFPEDGIYVVSCLSGAADTGDPSYNQDTISFSTSAQILFQKNDASNINDTNVKFGYIYVLNAKANDTLTCNGLVVDGSHPSFALDIILLDEATKIEYVSGSWNKDTTLTYEQAFPADSNVLIIRQEAGFYNGATQDTPCSAEPVEQEKEIVKNANTNNDNRTVLVAEYVKTNANSGSTLTCSGYGYNWSGVYIYGFTFQ